MNIEPLNGISTFVVAAKSGSFTEAAERLGVTKSAVGRSIARLEERLGVKLFHRTTRQITLSADGEAYFSACSTALEEISAAEHSLTSDACTPSGRLRVDMPVVFGRRVMLAIMLDLAREFPELELTLTFRDHLIDPIEEGVDLAVRFGEPKDSTGLIARRLSSQRWVICASPGYLAAHGTPQTLEEVESHRAIVGHRRAQPLSWRVSHEGSSFRYVPPATHQLSDGEAIIDAAVAGLGLMQFPLPQIRQELQEGKLVTVLDDYTQDLVDVHAVWPKVGQLRPKVRKLVDRLIALGDAGAFD